MIDYGNICAHGHSTIQSVKSHKKTDFLFHDLGEQKVKNTVLHAVDVTLDGMTQRKLSKTQQIKRSDPWKKYLAAPSSSLR